MKSSNFSSVDNTPKKHATRAIGFHILWGLVIAFSARVAAGQNDFVAISWLFGICFILPIIMPISFSITGLISIAVFLDQSLWFLHDTVIVDTIYEHPALIIKPPEVLIMAITIKNLAQKNISWRRNLYLEIMSFFWLTSLAISTATSLLHQIPIRNMLIYSEIRGPITFIISAWILYSHLKKSKTFYISIFAILVFIQLLISFISWSTGVSLLWVSYAPNYVGNWNAFFGADESVKIALVALTISLPIILSGAQVQFKNFGILKGQYFWNFLGIISLIAIISSGKRGGILHLGTILFVALTLLELRAKITLIKIIAIASVFGSIVLSLGIGSQSFQSTISRIKGEGRVEQSDSGRLSDFINASEHIQANILFGSGPGTKLDLDRVTSRGGEDSLSIHSSILHIWSRQGVFGVLSILLIYFLPILAVMRNLGKHAYFDRSHKISLVFLLGFMLGHFFWELFILPFYTGYRVSFALSFMIALIFITNEKRKANGVRN